MEEAIWSCYSYAAFLCPTLYSRALRLYLSRLLQLFEELVVASDPSGFYVVFGLFDGFHRVLVFMDGEGLVNIKYCYGLVEVFSLRLPIARGVGLKYGLVSGRYSGWRWVR